jgi:hypothetical protein
MVRSRWISSRGNGAAVARLQSSGSRATINPNKKEDAMSKSQDAKKDIKKKPLKTPKEKKQEKLEKKKNKA